MAVSSEALLEAEKCSICLATCNDAYCLPCEHFFRREPCLQGLLSAERSTCPDCRQGFSREDVRPFRTLNALLKRIQEASQANQQDNLATCPICVQQVETPLKMSEHFSKMVCGDCWRTGEMLCESTVEERVQPAASCGICRSSEFALQSNQHARDAWCPFCSQWVHTPLRMTQYFTKPVCNDCSRSAERLVTDSIRIRRHLFVSKQDRGQGHGDREIHAERSAAQNPPAARAHNLPTNTHQHASRDAKTTAGQGVGRSKKVPSAPTAPREKFDSDGRSEEGAAQNNRHACSEARCSICSQSVEMPLQMTAYYARPVCGECTRWAEFTGNNRRSQNVGGKAKRYVSYIAPEEDRGGRVKDISGSAAKKPRAATTPLSPRETNLQEYTGVTAMDTKMFSCQAEGRLAKETNPAASDSSLPREKSESNCRNDRGAPPPSEEKNQNGHPKTAPEGEKKSSTQVTSLSAGNVNTSIRVPPPPAKKPNLPWHKLAEKTYTIASAPPPSEEKNQNGHPNDFTKDGKKSSNQGSSISAGNANLSVRVPPPPAKKPNLPGHKLAEKTNPTATAPLMSEKKNQNCQPKDAPENDKKPSNQRDSKLAGNANQSARVPPPTAMKPNLNGHTQRTQEAGCSYCLKFEGTSMQTTEDNGASSVTSTPRETQQHEHNKVASNDANTSPCPGSNKSAEETIPSASVPTPLKKLIAHHDQTTVASKAISREGISRSAEKTHPTASAPPPSAAKNQNGYPNDSTKDGKKSSDQGTSILAGKTNLSARIPPPPAKKPNLPGHKLAEKTNPTATAFLMSEEKNQSGHPEDTPENEKKSSNQSDSKSAGNTKISAHVPPPTAKKPNLNGQTQSALEAGCSFCSRFAGTPMLTTEVALQQEMEAICPICYRRVNFRNKCERTTFEWNKRERNLQ